MPLFLWCACPCTRFSVTYHTQTHT
jgi:hypothetical protein